MEKYNILYVDDEPSNLRVFKDTFRRKFNIYTAISAKEGIQIMEEHHIDLILSDQRMPEMTGVEFLKYSFEKFPKTNRILITGYSDIDAVENAINKARIFQYIQKPWNEESLLEVIDDALRIYKLEKENIQQKKELQIAKEKAEESDLLKTELLENLSHEIRTPLNGIYGFSSLLGEPNLTKEKQNEYVGIIQKSSNQLVKVLNSVLDISKLVTKKVHVEKQEISLNNLFTELFSVFELKAKKKGLEFILIPGLEDDKSLIITDRAKLYQILCNILENAFKYTESGFVEFGYVTQQDKIKIYIKDTGVGIHPDNQQIIFERFSQEEKALTEKTGGLGLGLSIANENAKLIEALITLTSEKGKGSVFYIEIPYKEIIPIGKSKITDSTSLNLVNNDENCKIIIAEDEAINFLFLNILIKKILCDNVTILHAENGKEAIKLCKQNADVNMIFMDIKMPIMDGYEATMKIKEFMPKVPIIVQTAYSTKEDRQKAFDAGCDEFLSKPIDKYKCKEIFKTFLPDIYS